MEHESDGDTNCNWCTRYCHQRISTGTWRLGSNRTSGDHPNNSIIKIRQNTEKSPGDTRKFAVTQTPVTNRQLTLVWITLKREKIMTVAQKEFNSRHDWVSKVIHWKLSKRLKFDHTDKWYIQRPESIIKKSRYDWAGKVIHWELSKRLKFDHTDKWYMHKAESIPENGAHEIHWDFEI